MQMSQSITNVAAALCKFQAIVSNPKKDSVNPHFKSKYADLDSIITTIRPALKECGLSFIQNPVNDENGSIGIYTVLLHETGEYIRFDPIFIPVEKKGPHQVGAALTYARRYSLGAALGIATDEDDDGNSVQPTNANGSANKAYPQRQAKQGAAKPVGVKAQHNEQNQEAKQPEQTPPDRKQYLDSFKNTIKEEQAKPQPTLEERLKKGRQMVCLAAETKKGLTKEQRKAIVKAETGKDSLTKLDLEELIKMYNYFTEHDAEELKETAQAYLIAQKDMQKDMELNNRQALDAEIMELLGEPSKGVA